jgi:sterol desaturase/sphingolipid hydroxylase (fatty acid hydroxylase superfamily)
VHHAIEELNVTNCNHHFSEEFLKIIYVLPLSLVQLRTPDIAIITFLLNLQLALIHANSRISFGPLNYVVAGLLYHRVHHSIDTLHHNRNFATLFPIWDMLFRTAYFPGRDEWIKTGLLDKREAKTIVQYLFALPTLNEATKIATQRTGALEKPYSADNLENPYGASLKG